MDRAVVEKIAELAQSALPEIKEIDGVNYVINSDGNAAQILPDLHYVAEKPLHSLDALVKMVKTEGLELYKAPIYIEASGYDTVSCFLQPDNALRFTRQTLYIVKTKDVPGWDEKDVIPFEQAMIAARTRFQKSEDTDYLLRLLSSITCGGKVTYADNGVATTIVTSKGVALQDAEPIRPIIKLKPYRTFQEINQPASEFHIRITERGIRFIEADGGMWKLEARKTIVKYIEEALKTEAEAGRVVVML